MNDCELVSDFVSDAGRAIAGRSRSGRHGKLCSQRSENPFAGRLSPPAPVMTPFSPPVPGMIAADCEPIPQPQLTKMIDDVSAKHGVSADLVKEVAQGQVGLQRCVISCPREPPG